MTFDQVDVGRAEAGGRVRGRDRPALALDGGGEQVPGHVVREALSAENGEDVVLRGEGVGEPLEDEDARAFADDEAVGRRVERRAAARRREGAELREAHLRVLAVGPGAAAGEHRVRAAGEEFVRRELEGVKARRTGGVERVGPEAEAQRGGEQARGQARGVAVQGVRRAALAGPTRGVRETAARISRQRSFDASVGRQMLPRIDADLAFVEAIDLRPRHARSPTSRTR